MTGAFPMSDKTAAELIVPYEADAAVEISDADKAKQDAAEKAAKAQAKKDQIAAVVAAVAVSEFFVLSEDKKKAKVYTKGGTDGFTVKEYPSADSVVVPPTPVKPVVDPKAAPVAPAPAPKPAPPHEPKPEPVKATENYWDNNTRRPRNHS
jgi:hypothetical protein